MKAFGTVAVTQLLQIEVSRRNESIPIFFGIIQACVQRGFSLKKKCAKNAYTKFDVLSVVKALDTKNAHFATEIGKLHSFKMGEMPEPDLWEALLYCSSLGDCLFLNNSFFLDASFVRTQLALVLQQHFPKDSSQTFSKALDNYFELPSVSADQRTPNVMAPFKSSGNQMWVRTPTQPVGVFTNKVANQLKYWNGVLTTNE